MNGANGALPLVPALALSVVRQWARLYTWGLPAGAREARRAELESDVWEHCRHARGAGRAPAALALDVLVCLVAGAPSDVSWRWEAGGGALSLTGGARRVLRPLVFPPEHRRAAGATLMRAGAASLLLLLLLRLWLDVVSPAVASVAHMEPSVATGFRLAARIVGVVTLCLVAYVLASSVRRVARLKRPSAGATGNGPGGGAPGAATAVMESR